MDNEMSFFIYAIIAAGFFLYICNYVIRSLKESMVEDKNPIQATIAHTASPQWGTLVLPEFMKEAEFVAEFDQKFKNRNEWIKAYQQSSDYTHIQPYSEVGVVEMVSRAHNSGASGAWYANALAASSFIYGTKVPMHALNANMKAVRSMVIDYLIATFPLSRDSVLEGYKQSNNDWTNRYRSDEDKRSDKVSLELCEALTSAYLPLCVKFGRLASFPTVRDWLIKNKSNYAFVSDQDLKKALTLMLCRIGMYVPTDCVYADNFVVDYLERNQRIHIFDKLKVV